MKNEKLMKIARSRLVGFAVHCGLELDSVEPGHVAGHCALRPELLNPYGFTHGGAINTIMDTFGGIAASGASEPPRYVVTRSADVHYVRPLMGSRMDVRCEVIKAGKQTCLVRAEALDDEGRLCTEGLLEFFYVSD